MMNVLIFKAEGVDKEKWPELVEAISAMAEDAEDVGVDERNRLIRVTSFTSGADMARFRSTEFNCRVMVDGHNDICGFGARFWRIGYESGMEIENYCEDNENDVDRFERMWGLDPRPDLELEQSHER